MNSTGLGRHIWRASRWWLLTLLLFVLLLLIKPLRYCDFRCPWFTMLGVTIITGLIISVCHRLTNYFSLRKKETNITWCQITILLTIGIWIIALLFVFKIQKSPNNFLVLGIIGTLMGWIFQDTIKGVVAFFHLRSNHLLQIDDWIKIPKHNIDGVVKHVTLTTVIIYNWDTTTSSIPTSVLHSDHFINLQKMKENRTYGRLMEKTFTIDTGSIQALSSETINQLKQMEQVNAYLLDKDMQEGVLNAHLFRLYLFHWLMNQPYISQHPQLVVRWREQAGSGMPLQLYAFITEGGFSAFEWKQSVIIEHVLESLKWFGLKLK